MDISKWGFQNRNLVYFLVAVLLAGGALACYQMSKLEDPEIKVKLAMVATTYPGASAHQVELEVTDVLEKSIRKMDNVDNVESYSFNDLSLIQVELLTTVKDDDVEQHWDLLRRKVNDASALLPSGANTPIVQDDFGKVFGMFYALTGDGLSDREMADYAELIKREVVEIEGVDRVDIYGERSECINISLLQDRMANLGVKPAEVLATLNGQNETTYSGYYDNGDNRIRVTVNDRFKTVDDIGKMFIQGHDDDQLRLRDIALIEKGYEDPTRNEMFYNQERSIGILVAASSGSDIVKVGKAVEAKLAELKDNRLPAGVDCHKIFYQPERVGDSLGTFVINLIESVVIVVFILMLAMGFKSGLIIGISLVVTVFGSFLFLQFAGGTMQRVSLAAFVLAMGMLAGCSGAPAAPNTPLPNDAEALALYQGVSETCKKYNVKTPVYCAELEPIAQEIAKAAVIHLYYTTQPSAAVINKAKMDVSALMDGAEYLVYELNPYDTAAKAPLSVNSMKNTIIQKGANRVGIAIVTLTNADTKEEVKYECTVYVRFPDAAAQE